ncbi:MAG: hypothetical protein J5J00_08735 [Deltaproteobacteria bacterium]|nr:hypothetical protein [Deltaproteobacteria bacterium]
MKTLIALACTAFIPLICQAETFVNGEQGFQIELPGGMEMVQMESPVVGLALRPEEEGLAYPTFNVIQQSGTLDLSRSTREIADELLNDYRLVGFSDVQLLSSFIWDVSNARRFTATLEYTLAGKRLCSEVTLVPAHGKRFILTFIDTCENGKKTNDLSKALRERFQVLGEPQSAHRDGVPTSTSSPLTIPLIAGAAAALTLLFIFLRRKAAGSKI